MATVRSDLFMCDRSTCSRAADHQNGYVVPAPLVVAVQHAGYDPRMAARKPRIIRQIPMRCQPVTVEDEQRASGHRKVELLHPAHPVAEGPVMRHELPPHFARLEPAGDVSN